MVDPAADHDNMLLRMRHSVANRLLPALQPEINAPVLILFRVL